MKPTLTLLTALLLASVAALSAGTIRCELAVIGGGSGGFGAALAAARAGVEMVNLEPMLVACAKSATSDSWKSVEQFEKDNLLAGKAQPRFFATSWRSGGRAVTVGPDVKDNESFTIKTVFGGRYVVQNVQQPYDAGPGPMGVYRDEAKAYRWLSLHGFKFTLSGTIYEYSGSPLKLTKMYVPIVEPVKDVNQGKDK